MLLERLENRIGERGKALEWFASYLSDRTVVVSTDGVLSNVATSRVEFPRVRF